MLGELVAKAANQEDERRQKKFELMKRHVRAMERIAAALETLAGLKSRAAILLSADLSSEKKGA